MNPYDVIEDAAVSLGRKSRYDERNRLTLLTIHGLIGLTAGALLTYDGAPMTYQSLVGTEVHHMLPLALTALIGGAMLLAGLLFNRNLMLEAIGMAFMLAWDLMMTATFFVGRITGESENWYPVMIYAGLAAMMTTHLLTLVTYIRRKKVKTNG